MSVRYNNKVRVNLWQSWRKAHAHHLPRRTPRRAALAGELFKRIMRAPAATLRTTARRIDAVRRWRGTASVLHGFHQHGVLCSSAFACGPTTVSAGGCVVTTLLAVTTEVRCAARPVR